MASRDAVLDQTPLSATTGSPLPPLARGWLVALLPRRQVSTGARGDVRATQAPRWRRSWGNQPLRCKNAKKAREIVRGKATETKAETKTEAKEAKKAENEVAETIAAWIEATWNDKGDWAGAPSEIPERIRAGEWRKPRKAEAEAAE